MRSPHAQVSRSNWFLRGWKPRSSDPRDGPHRRRARECAPGRAVVRGRPCTGLGSPFAAFAPDGMRSHRSHARPVARPRMPRAAWFALGLAERVVGSDGVIGAALYTRRVGPAHPVGGAGELHRFNRRDPPRRIVARFENAHGHLGTPARPEQAAPLCARARGSDGSRSGSARRSGPPARVWDGDGNIATQPSGCAGRVVARSRPDRQRTGVGTEFECLHARVGPVHGTTDCCDDGHRGAAGRGSVV